MFASAMRMSLSSSSAATAWIRRMSSSTVPPTFSWKRRYPSARYPATFPAMASGDSCEIAR